MRTATLAFSLRCPLSRICPLTALSCAKLRGWTKRARARGVGPACLVTFTEVWSVRPPRAFPEKRDREQLIGGVVSALVEGKGSKSGDGGGGDIRHTGVNGPEERSQGRGRRPYQA